MTNYTRGRDYEYKTVNLLRDQGYHAQRTAGSHGLFDAVAVGHGQVRLINIKAGYWPPPAEREAFYGLDVPGRAVVELPYTGYKHIHPVTLEIWRWDKGDRMHYIRLEEDW